MRTVVFWCAVCVSPTGSANAARVLALPLVTALVDWTVVVSTATIKAAVCLTDFAKRTILISGTLHFSYATAIVTRSFRSAIKFSVADIGVSQALSVWVA